MSVRVSDECPSYPFEDVRFILSFIFVSIVTMSMRYEIPLSVGGKIVIETTNNTWCYPDGWVEIVRPDV